ncbi:MAG: hypothetical protein RLZZ398_1629 [Verrucomicrobiota bacterium]
MKTTLYSLLAAAACGMALGQTAYTTPVGYTTQTLVTGYNNVGISVHAPAKAAGDLNVISASSVQDTTVGVNFTASLGATGTLHVLEITSGPAVGLVTEITNWTTDTITTVDNLVAAGVLGGIDGAGNTYRIRKAPTLEEIFGAVPATSVLTANANFASADIVWVPTATPGVYTQYFLSTLSGGTFRKVSPAGAALNTPLVYLDGIFVQRKAAGTKDLVVSGEVKIDQTNGSLVTGFNYIGTVYPIGSTIQNIGLEDDLTPNANFNSADIVWVPAATPGVYTQIFRSTLSGGTWRTVSPAAAITTPFPLTGAVFIQRKGAPTPYDIVPPSTWSVAP